jgi:hypothetical protein
MNSYSLVVTQRTGSLAYPASLRSRLLGKEEAGIEAIEVLGTEAGRHDGLHIEGGLESLTGLLAAHEAGLVVQDGGGPAARLDDARLDLRQRLDTIPGVLLDEHGVVVLAGFHPGQAHRRVGDGDEKDLIEVGGPLTSEAVRRLGARRVVAKARELDVAVGLVLDKAVGTGSGGVLEGAVASRVDHLLEVDRRMRFGEAED